MSTPESRAHKSSRPRTVALLLAAGRGRRFDRSGQRNKLLAIVNREPIAVRSARNLRACELPVLAVVRPDSDELSRALREAGCQVSVCAQADRGMGHSLAHGAALIREDYGPEVILVALADMPFLSPETIRAVAERTDADHSIVAAAIDGKRGHPVAFWQKHFQALTELTGDAGANALLKANPVTLIAAADEAVVRDIDRPQDLPHG